MYVDLRRRHDRPDLSSRFLDIVYLGSSRVDQPVEPVCQDAVNQTAVREIGVMRVLTVNVRKRPLHERNGVNSSQAHFEVNARASTSSREQAQSTSSRSVI